MKAKRGLAVALAAVALAAGPLGAQANSSVVGPPAPRPNDIGPGELSNFSLPGTVTRPVDRPAVTPPAATKPVPATTAPATSAPGTTAPAVTTNPAPARAPRPAAQSDTPATRQSTSGNDLFARPPTLPDAGSATEVDAVPPLAPVSTPLPEEPATGSGSLWPWIIGALALVGGGLLWFVRQRRDGDRYAAAGEAPIDIIRQPDVRPRADPPIPASPRPDPIPAMRSPEPSAGRRPVPTTLMPPQRPAPRSDPRVTPRPDPIVPGAIVSTALRPWIDVELSPDRALIDEQGAAIAFEVTLYNSGSAAARDVIIEAKLLNAGSSQDVELSAFFTAASTVSDSIPQIAPYARIPLRSAVRLPRESISEYEYEGRKLFMPLVAISVRYRWSNGDGQSAAGFLVGQSGEGQEKLAPLRIDRGARSWNGLGARRYEKGVRR